jgi:hypothetical protein
MAAWRPASVGVLLGPAGIGRRRVTVVDQRTARISSDAQCVPRDTHTSFALDFM